LVEKMTVSPVDSERGAKRLFSNDAEQVIGSYEKSKFTLTDSGCGVMGHSKGTKKPLFGKESFYHLLNAVVTSPLRPKRTLSECLLSSVRSRTRRYDRVAAAMHLLDSIIPGMMGRISSFLFSLRFLPLRPVEITLMACGSGSTVFSFGEGEGRGVLKIYRRSLGRGREDLMEIIAEFQRRYRRLYLLYGDLAIMQPSLFLIVHGPFFRVPAAACVQPYIEGEKSDFLADHSDGDLIEILRGDDPLRHQFEVFARRTLDLYRGEGLCVDLLGYANLMLVEREGRRNMCLVDYRIFEVDRLRKDTPAVFERLETYLSRLETLMGELGRSDS